MRSSYAIYAVCLVAALAGCALGSTPEQRINAAIPVSEEALLAKAALFERESADRRRELEAEFEARLRARAILCAKSYFPSRFASKEEILSKLPNRTCFTESDAETAAWLKRRRVALLLKDPPLRPIPTPAPAFITADETIASARFADEAGVALLSMHGGLQIVELRTGKIIFREAGNTSLSTLSPNGRLFTSGGSDRIRIRDAETGATLFELSGSRTFWFGFHWLDSRYAIYHNQQKAMLFDFESGRESAIGGLQGSITHVARVAGAANQYFLVSARSIAKIEVTSSKEEPPQVTLLRETTTEKPAWGAEATCLHADSARYFQTGQNLTITTLDTFEQAEVSLSPFLAQSCVVTGDPDKVIISAHAKDQSVRAHGSVVEFVYSVSAKTVSRLDRTQLGTGRLIYIPPLKKVGLVAHSKVTVLDTLPMQESIALSDFVSEAIEAANRQKFDAAERDAALVRAAPFRDLAKDARIEAIGVYEGDGASHGHGLTRKAGQVEVRISRSEQPLVLVLTSYEPVRWKLIQEPGARLSGVLVSGHHPSEVIGAANARTVMIGSAYAYEHNGRDFQTLDAAVYQYTGKRISRFQGVYRGGAFGVGGAIPAPRAPSRMEVGAPIILPPVRAVPGAPASPAAPTTPYQRGDR